VPQYLLPGIALTMVAGLMSGNCMLPMKFTRSWKWENVWVIFSLVSLVVLPWTLAIALVGNLFATYHALSIRQLATPMLLGAGWGIAQILFGISVERLGLGLAYAIIVGLGAVLGTLVPLFLDQRTAGKEHAMGYILIGVADMVAGIFLTAWGGQIRERAAPPNDSDAITSGLSGGDRAGSTLRLHGTYVELLFCFWSGYCAGSRSARKSGSARRLCGLANRIGRRLCSEHCLQSVSALKESNMVLVSLR